MKFEKELTFTKMLKFNRYFRMIEPTIPGKIKYKIFVTIRKKKFCFGFTGCLNAFFVHLGKAILHSGCPFVVRFFIT